MTLTELRRLVRKGEGPDLEFKRSTGELKEGMKSLCGMLNASGNGSVLFGIADDGSIIGQKVAQQTLREIANLSRLVEPHVDIKTKRTPLKNDLEVLAMTAQAQGSGPYTFDGRGYVRIGNTTQRMSRAEFDRRTSKQLKIAFPWDEWIAKEWKVKDLDPEEITRTVELATEKERLTGALGEKPETILRRLKLVTDKGVTWGAVVLFGKEEGAGLHPGKLRLARFRGTTKDEFMDNRIYHGHAFDLFRQAEKFLNQHVRVASEFIPGQLARRDIPMYPPIAYREALINAFVHRDYSVPGGAVSVAMYDDRLEIWSTGVLPDGVTVRKLKGVHESVLRNPRVADTFNLRGMIEEWGRGTNKILREAKKLGCPEPEFEEISGAFVVRFWPVPQVEKNETELLGVDERRQKVIAIIRNQGPLRVSAIFKALGQPITLRALQKELKKLRDSGEIASSGKGKATLYEAPKRGNGS